MTRGEEFACKLDRVRRWLSESELDGAVLSRSDNFAWLGCGANSVVNSAQESGVGAIGYRPREYIATPDGAEMVRACQAFAWNPSIRGTKSEDTILVREEGFELLTAPGPDWPLVQTQAAGRADILVR
jgi:Xaa-Pro aminopeptidase